MKLTDPGELRALLERHGFRPRKAWGQHFLISDRVVDAVLLRLDGVAGILEVGPGPGVLTSPMSERAQVLAVEVDPIAVSALAESAPRAEVVAGDALKVDLAGLLDRLPEPRALVSNMPYNITGPLLTRFAELRRGFAKAVLMMQREVGKRLTAEAGSSEFGSLSVFIQSQFEVRRVCDAPPGAFYPPPKVSSVVLELVPNAAVPSPWFFELVRLGFAQPRKTLANNFSAAGLSRDAIEALGLDASVRPHQVPVATWHHLAQATRP